MELLEVFIPLSGTENGAHVLDANFYPTYFQVNRASVFEFCTGNIGNDSYKFRKEVPL